MNAAAQPHGRYQQDPMPFVALAAIAGGASVSLPALVLGIALAPLAARPSMCPTRARADVQEVDA